MCGGDAAITQEVLVQWACRSSDIMGFPPFLSGSVGANGQIALGESLTMRHLWTLFSFLGC
jgi:hypothetical protein